MLAGTILPAVSVATKTMTGLSTSVTDGPSPRPPLPRSLRRSHRRRPRYGQPLRDRCGRPRGQRRCRNGFVRTGRLGAPARLNRPAMKRAAPDTRPGNLVATMLRPRRGRLRVAPSKCGRAALPTCCSILKLTTTRSRFTLRRMTASGEQFLRGKIGSRSASATTGRRHGATTGRRHGATTGRRHGAASDSHAGGWTLPSSHGRSTPA